MVPDAGGFASATNFCHEEDARERLGVRRAKMKARKKTILILFFMGISSSFHYV
jgi:hypothetical protein